MSPLETESGTLMSSFIVDITERKRTHDEIQRLNAELEMRVAHRTAQLSESNEPPAPMRSYSEMEGGGEDSQWVWVRGVVQAAWIAPSWGRSVLFLEIDLGGAHAEHRVVRRKQPQVSQYPHPNESGGGGDDPCSSGSLLRDSRKNGGHAIGMGHRKLSHVQWA
jgi:hypothetical protein